MQTRIVVKTHKHMSAVIARIQQTTHQRKHSDTRRHQWRLRFGTPGTATADDGSVSAESIYISTQDISASGLGFIANRDLKPGQTLLVTIETDFGDIEIPCTVMHSTVTIGGHKVGVQFHLSDEDGQDDEG